MSNDGFHIEFTGVSELLQQFQVAGAKAQQVTEDTMRTTLGKAQQRSKQLAPVRTGFMQNSIEVYITESTRDRVLGEINAKADYSSFNELGTYKMPARPFVAPAVKASADWFYTTMRQKLEGLVK